MSEDIVNIIVNSSVNNASVNVHECEKCLQLETELQTDFIEKEIYDKLFKSFTTLEKHCISLEVDSQLNQEIFKRDNSVIKSKCSSFDQLSKIKQELKEIETINIELDHRVTKLIAENEHLKQTYKQLYDSTKPARIQSKEQCDDLINQVNLKSAEISDLNACLQEKFWYAKLVQELLTNIGKTFPSVNNTDEKLVAVTPKNKDKRVRFTEPVTTLGNTNTKTTSPSNLVSNKPMLSSIGVKPSASASGSQYSVVNVACFSDNHDLCVLDFINNVNARKESKSVNKSSKRKVWKPTGKVDYQIGNVTISRVYYVEGLGHNLFSVGQFCDSNLEVDFRQHTCFIRNLEGVDLLTKSRGNNLYTLSLGDMMTTLGSNNPSKTASLVRGLPKLKFEKDHLCSACAMDFDELTAMASEYSSSGPALHEMTPATISSRFVPNPPPSTMFVPPSRSDWDLLFQPMFDELPTPPPSVDYPATEVVALIHEVVALVPAESTRSPLLGFRASTLSTTSNS
ncbi:hypothetical protein Tco_0620762 [Tanacetum coccineum]